MKRANLARGLVILAMAIFFVYRYWQLGSSFYWAYIIIFALAGLLSLIDKIADRWQNIVLNLGLGLVFLDFVFAEINLAEVGRELAGANYLMLIPSIVMSSSISIFAPSARSGSSNRWVRWVFGRSFGP